jgi:hypothetical protein
LTILSLPFGSRYKVEEQPYPTREIPSGLTAKMSADILDSSSLDKSEKGLDNTETGYARHHAVADSKYHFDAADLDSVQRRLNQRHVQMCVVTLSSPSWLRTDGTTITGLLSVVFCPVLTLRN